MADDKKDELTTVAVDETSSSGSPYGEGVVSKEAAAQAHIGSGAILTGLKGRAVSGTIATVISQGIQFVLSLGSTIWLARLLNPEEFGLVFMVTPLMGFMRILNEAGLSTATVQREGITHAQVSNLFWINVSLGCSMTLLLAILSPVLAWFYHKPELIAIGVVLSVTFVIFSSAVQHLALLKRQMRNGSLAVIQVSAMAASVLTGVVMAWKGCGYWSLVMMQIAWTSVYALLAWVFSHWRPQLPKRDSGTRSLIYFGAQLMASSMLWSSARMVDGFLIGRFYNAGPLGLYSRAMALLVRPLEQFLPPLDAVFVPPLARLQTDPQRYRRLALQVYDIIAVGSFLFAPLLLVLAHPLMLVVLGKKWEEVTPIFMGFSLLAIYMPACLIAGWVITSQGRGRHFLWLGIISSAATVIAFVAGLAYGPAGVATAYSVASMLVLLPILYYISGRQGPVTTSDLWGHFFTHFPLWLVVCGATFLVYRAVPNLAPWKQLVVCGPAGVLAGIAFTCVYPPGRHTLRYLIHTLLEFKNRHKGASPA